MARMILMKDTKPLVLRKEDVPDDGVWVCRCGLSAEWPMCDSSHAQARQETGDRVYRYHRLAPGGALQVTVTDEDPSGADPRPDPVEEASA